MSSTQSDYAQLSEQLQSGGPDAVLAELERQLKSQGRCHELFEALKMKLRRQLDLPLFAPETEEFEGELRDRWEAGLLAACREVGTLLLAQGQLREAWMYLRPLGDRQLAAQALADVEIDEDNLEEVIEVALHEGVDVGLGFSLVLEHYGTCNSITTFESVLQQRTRAEQRTAAEMLLRHLHAELLATVTADVAQQEGQEPAEKTLKELVAERDWLFSDASYHIDTTHLSSTVRFSRLLDDPAALRLALDLTEYGRRLHEQFRYPGDEPFRDNYEAHALFFSALLGENVEEAIAYFGERAKSLNPYEHGSAPVEVYVDLLARLGRYAEAMEARMTLWPNEAQPMGFAPPLIELAQKAGRLPQLTEACCQRGDLLGYATGLVLQAEQSGSGEATDSGTP